MAKPIELRYDLAKFSADIERFIREEIRESDRIVFETAANVLADIQDGWPVNRAKDIRPNANVEPGVSRAAWTGPTKEGNAHYSLSNPLPYAGVIEFGGYPGAGPLTAPGGPETLPGDIRIEAGIFPTQKPIAPVRRALSKNRDEIPRKLVESQRKLWGR